MTPLDVAEKLKMRLEALGYDFSQSKDWSAVDKAFNDVEMYSRNRPISALLLRFELENFLTLTFDVFPIRAREYSAAILQMVSENLGIRFKVD